MKREDKAPPLPWTLILIVLIGVGTAAWLTLGEGRPMWEAYGVVALVMGGLTLCLGLVLCGMTPRRGWPELIALARKTFYDDWRAVRAAMRQTFWGN